MYETVKLFNYLLPFLYAFTIIAYYIDFVKEDPVFSSSKKIALSVTLCFHVLYLLFRTVVFNHPPITNVFEIFTILAFALTFSYFLLEFFSKVSGTGLFILIFSLIFQLLSTIFIQDLSDVNPILRNRLLGLHVINAMLGYSGITVSAVYGFLYLILYKDLKLNRFGLIFHKLPNLEILESLSFYAACIGFVLLSFAIIIGVVWLPSAFPDFRLYDPKLVGTALIWLIYGVGILAKVLWKFRGKRVIYFSLTGFCIAIISLLASSFIGSSFHSFY